MSSETTFQNCGTGIESFQLDNKNQVRKEKGQ